MRCSPSLPVLAVIVLLLPGLALAQEGKKKKRNARKDAVALFDGKTLEGWSSHLIDPDVKMQDVWSVKDGVLVCKGEPLGYLETDKEYENFVLFLEWRWAPDSDPKKRNSGVLLRITGKPVGFMPKCIEAQLKSGGAGDIWAFRGFMIGKKAEGYREIKDHEDLGDFMGVPRAKDTKENDPGEWNKYRLVFRGKRLATYVNGKKASNVNGCDQVAGKIGLQSEGAEIHFRNIKITPID